MPTTCIPCIPYKVNAAAYPNVIASSGNVGMSVEIRRERGPGLDVTNNALPSTPLPLVSGALQNASASGESIVLYLGQARSRYTRCVTLDIFVFNQSLWSRRFEVTCPGGRRRRRGGAEMGVNDGGGEAARKMGYPGVLPMDNRVRIE
jgi:hypothetical protein